MHAGKKENVPVFISYAFSIRYEHCPFPDFRYVNIITLKQEYACVILNC